MTKSKGSNKKMPVKPNVEVHPEVQKCIDSLANKNTVSTARYLTYYNDGSIKSQGAQVCFHAISSACSGAQGLAVVFQGYGGFNSGERWRDATEDDLYTNKTYPFIQADKGHYNEVSRTWLEFLLDTEGPFKSLLPHMLETSPELVQSRRAFIFPDVSSIPARLTWCFAIASRLGFANARSLWRYIHLLDKGLDKRTAALIAGGFEHEVKDGKITGRLIKSYTCGFLGVDTTAYAGRFLTSNPVEDQPFSKSPVNTNGSSKVFLSGKIDMDHLRFDDWQSVIDYTQQRGRDQSAELKLEKAA